MKTNRVYSSLALFCVIAALYLLTSAGRPRVIDEHMVFFQTESLARNATLAVPRARALGVWYGKEGRDGQPYSPYGPLHALVLVPSFGAGMFIATATAVPENLRDLVLGYFLVSFHAVVAALVAVLFYRLLLCLEVCPRLALLGSLGLAFATPMWPYSGTLFSEVWAALLLLAAALFVERGTREEIMLGPAAVAGALLGLAVLTRPTHALAAVVFGLAFLVGPGQWRRRRGAFLLLGLTSGAGLLTLLLYNHSVFGNPFDFGYPRELDAGRDNLVFDQPLATGIFGFLVSPGKSVLLFAPLMLLAIAGLPALWQQRRSLAVIAMGTLPAYLLFFATYRYWEGGYCYGPRYLVPVIPLLLLGLAPKLKEGRLSVQRLTLGLCILGALVQVPGVFTSFLEDQVGGGNYYDSGFRYQMAHNPILAQTYLLLTYSGAALRGDALASPLGKGLDLWFLFLGKAGVSGKLIVALLISQGFLLLAGLSLFRRQRRIR